MSVFGKFQTDENWRSALKSLLCTERKTVLKTATLIKEHQRYSQDITEELKDILRNRHCKPDFMDTPSKSDIDHISDESFQALERMCDKTASDPNSTLFKYLNSDNKQQMLSVLKTRNSNEDKHAEFFKNFDLFERASEDCTFLEDIEAPSQMWENTASTNLICQTSPTKAIGLLRPSTILEEAEDDTNNSDSSSHKSFKTAPKAANSDASSSVYDTPFENTFAKGDITCLDKSEMRILPSEKQVLNTEQIDNTATEMRKPENEWQLGNAEENQMCPDFNDSVVEVSSEEDSEDNPNSIKSLASVKLEKSANESILKSTLRKELFKEFHDENKENCNFSNTNTANNSAGISDISENSMHFNDTMEEVGYILEKGMKFMAAETALRNAEVPVLPPPVLPPPIIPPPKVYNSNLLTDNSPINVKPTFVTPKAKTIQKNLHAFDMKPFPKLNVFSKVNSNNGKHNKMPNFSHIVSPISTYIHKTPTAPLMANVRMKGGNPENSNSPAFRELVRESHLYKFDPAAKAVLNKKLPTANPERGRLPKKAYISSTLKYIIDERTPVTIPGGQKIQKYLENATTSTVLKHHGKLKIAKDALEDTSRSSVDRPTQANNASLADLSVMSGDISLYTMVDAQKFKNECN